MVSYFYYLTKAKSSDIKDIFNSFPDKGQLNQIKSMELKFQIFHSHIRDRFYNFFKESRGY